MSQIAKLKKLLFKPEKIPDDEEVERKNTKIKNLYSKEVKIYLRLIEKQVLEVGDDQTGGGRPYVLR